MERYNRLYSWVNSVRGSIDVSLATKLSYYVLLLKYVELRQLDCYKELYSVSYLPVLFGEKINVEQLIDYFRDIENELRIPDGIISQGFENITKRGSSLRTMKESLNLVDSLKIDNEEQLEDVLEEIMGLEFSSYVKSASEVITSSDLAKLEGRLLKAPSDATIYDGYCGYATSIMEASEKDSQLVIRDINMGVLAIGVINLIIHGRTIESVLCGDSNFDTERHYQYVISEPPINVPRDEGYLEHLSNMHPPIFNRRTVEIERSINAIADGGRGVILVPMSFLSSGGTIGDFRKNLLEQGMIESVVQLPPGAISAVSVSTALVLIDKAKHNNSVLFIDTADYWVKRHIGCTLDTEGLSAILDIDGKRAEISGVSAVVSLSEIAENDYNLTPRFYTAPDLSGNYQAIDTRRLLMDVNKLEYDLRTVCKDLNYLRQEK